MNLYNIKDEPHAERKSETIGDVIGTSFKRSKNKIIIDTSWSIGDFSGKVPPVFYRDPAIMKILCLPGLPPSLDTWTDWMSKMLHEAGNF